MECLVAKTENPKSIMSRKGKALYKLTQISDQTYRGSKGGKRTRTAPPQTKKKRKFRLEVKRVQEAIFGGEMRRGKK